ncbi:MAG: GPP34 family phosphoprotein [Myxococcales bacterium]|nr:GPP34 family phosphoprotein [Myxococcales bacterium]
MLFALHDAKGTIHHAAFVAIDHGLRGALIAELKLRGYVQTRSDGTARLHPSAPRPPTTPLLRDGLAALAPSPAPVTDWLDRLALVMPDLRVRTVALLEGRGLLRQEDRDRVGLVDAHAFPMVDGSAERACRRETLEALDAGDEITPRDGALVGLTVACHLEQEVLGGRAADGVARATWVGERDAVVRATVRAIAIAEGTWEG